MSLLADPACFCSVLNASPYITFLSQNQKDPGLPESWAVLVCAPTGAQSLKGGPELGILGLNPGSH